MAIRLSNSSTSSNDAKASAVNAIAEDDVDDGVSAEIISIIDSITTVSALYLFIPLHHEIDLTYMCSPCFLPLFASFVYLFTCLLVCLLVV